MKGDRGGYINYPEIQNLLESLRRRITAVENREDASETPEDGEDPITPGSGGICGSGFLEGESTGTGLTDVYGVLVQNEYLYLPGFQDPSPKFQSYRITAEGGFELLDEISISQQIKRFILHAGIVFGCNDGADGQNLIAIDVSNPWELNELDQLDVDFAAYGLVGQGGFVYVVGGTDDIAVIDISDPDVMRKVN